MTDGVKIWQDAMNSLHGDGKVLKTRKGLGFLARAHGQSIIIDRADTTDNACDLNKPRTITQKNFLEAFPLCMRQIIGESGLSQSIQQLTNNASYIIAIIRACLYPA